MPGIGSLIVDMQLRLAQFTQSTNEVKQQLVGIGNLATKTADILKTAFAGIAIGATINDFKNVINLADDIGDIADAFGITNKQISEFRAIAKVANLEMEDLTTIFAKFSKQVSDAKGGDEGALRLLKAFGITADDLRSKDFSGLLNQALEQINRFEGSENKVTLLRDAFGKTGFVMDDFSKKLKELRPEIGKLSAQFDEGLVKNADEFNKQLALLSLNAEKAKVALLSDLLPALNRIINAFLEAKKRGEGFFSSLAAGIQSAALGDEVEVTKDQIKSLTAELAKVDSQFSNLQKPRKLALLELDTETPAQKAAANAAAFNKLMVERKRITDQLVTAQAHLKVLTEPGVITGKTPDEEKKIKAPAIPKTDTSVQDAKAKAEEALRALERAISDEQQISQQAVDILQAMLSQNLISYQTFYAERARLQNQSLDVSKAAYDKEIKLLESLSSKVKDESDKAAIRTKIADLVAKRGDAEQKVAVDSVKANLESSKAAEQYRRQVQELTASLDELQGKTREAALARADLQQVDLRKQATLQNDPDTTAKLDRQRELLANQAEINALLQQSSILQDQLANTEDRARIAFETGANGELTTMLKIGEARKAAADQLSTIAQKYVELAALSGNDALRQQAENFRVQVERLAASADLVKQKFQQIGEGAFATFLTDLADRTKSVSDAFKGMVNNILSEINRLAAQDIAKRLFGDTSKPGGSGGVGGFFSTLVDKAIGFFTGKAAGGPVFANAPYIVGEEGPELFVPRQSGTIVPNGAQVSGGGMALTQNFIMQGSADLRTQKQVARSAFEEFQRNYSRNS